MGSCGRVKSYFSNFDPSLRRAYTPAACIAMVACDANAKAISNQQTIGTSSASTEA